MDQLFHVSSSPHIRDKSTTDNIMLWVIIALMPTTLFGFYNFGLRAIVLVLTTVASCVFFEWGYNKMMHKPQTIHDLSAIVTGLLLGLNLPPTLPVIEAIIGSFFAIIIVKALFGGLGQNFMNPALGARCFLLITFAADMTQFAIDSYSGATPLAMLRNGETINIMNAFIGKTSGVIGETSALCILIGACILLIKHIIDIKIPFSYIGSFIIFILLFSGKGMDINYVLSEVLSGGLLLGSIFMATDYVTSPITPNGKIIYGVCCGILTGLFRLFGANAEGVSFAIILSNLLVPLIERVTIPHGFGYRKEGGK